MPITSSHIVIMRRITALFIMIISLAVANVTYTNYKLFEVVPETYEQLEYLRFVRLINKFNYWQEPSSINRPVFLMVSRGHALTAFYKMMEIFKKQYYLQIDDIQKLIDNTIPQNQSQEFDFKSYHTLEKIYNNLDELAKKYPNKVEVVVAGKTYEERDIKGVKIISGEEKPGIFIEGGLHGREWIAPATVMYILHQLLTSDDSRVRYIADNHNWFIFPVLNPDGYVYTHTHDRLWSKTRKPSSPTCIGSDPNRNWDFQWNKTDTITIPCANDFPGEMPFSEPEIKTISNYMSNLDFYTYVSFQSFGQKLMTPVNKFSWQERLMDKATVKLEEKYDTIYEIGTVADLDCPLSGTSAAYVADVMKKNVFVYKLRDNGKYGFLLPSEQIIPTGEETLESLIVIFNETLSRTRNENN